MWRMAGATTRELLAWLSARPRTYAETIEAWRTSCPQSSVWDDAVIAGLVSIQGESGRRVVSVSGAGRELLAGSPAP